MCDSIADLLEARLKETPDPEPQPESLEDQMRRVVEKHEFLREQLEWDALSGGDVIPWMWKSLECTRKSRLDRDLCMLVIRGIVKAKINAAYSIAECPDWFQYPDTDGPWYWSMDSSDEDSFEEVDTELEAIDALLTEMGKRGEA